MAAEMPDIEAGHVLSPTADSELGAKSAGGAPGGIMNAINDALAPMGVVLTAQPATPERILRALGNVD
jgi:aerobic carbon-monoxide dehydrogenase large subunit